jgi:hypothetical protein
MADVAVPRWHWLHRWTKWERITVTRTYSGLSSEFNRQLRRCVICGREQLEAIL